MFLLFSQPLKQQYSKRTIGDLAYPWQENKIKNWRLINKKNQLHAMQHFAESIFVVDYLREYESIFETALAHE
jgi:hypothetical protein